MAAAIAVSHYKDLLNFIVPNDQSFNNDDYCGAFHFRFWIEGEWYTHFNHFISNLKYLEYFIFRFDVVIDDYLPVNAITGLLICTRNVNDKDELWCSLLEKAYAKVNSCYEFLDGGLTIDGLVDLTGGIDETIIVNEIKDHNNLWKFIKKSYNFKSMMGANMFADENATEISYNEMILDNGLIAGHAYAITNVIEIDNSSNSNDNFSSFTNSSNKICLIRLRNPWGFIEWNGRFSDGSIEWNSLTESQKQDIGLVNKEDGEFW